MSKTVELLAVYWEWTEETKYAGSRFWGCHGVENDGRITDWPRHGMRPIGAAKVVVTEGEGLELLPLAAAERVETAITTSGQNPDHPAQQGGTEANRKSISDEARHLPDLHNAAQIFCDSAAEVSSLEIVPTKSGGAGHE